MWLLAGVAGVVLVERKAELGDASLTLPEGSRIGFDTTVFAGSFAAKELCDVSKLCLDETVAKDVAPQAKAGAGGSTGSVFVILTAPVLLGATIPVVLDTRSVGTAVIVGVLRGTTAEPGSDVRGNEGADAEAFTPGA